MISVMLDSQFGHGRKHHHERPGLIITQSFMSPTSNSRHGWVYHHVMVAIVAQPVELQAAQEVEVHFAHVPGSWASSRFHPHRGGGIIIVV